MLNSPKVLSIFILLFQIFLVSCSNTRILVEGTKKIILKEEKTVDSKEKNITQNDMFTKGHYKIGKPYKIDNKKYFPKLVSFYDKEGIASWYGPKFDKKLTANGEIFDQNLISAAHKTLPLPSIVKVTNITNSKDLYIRVNDRGPFVNDRIIDLSKEAAIKLNIYHKGTENVKVKLIDTGPHLLNRKYLDHFFLTKYASRIEKENLKNNNLNVNSTFIQLGAFSNIENANSFINQIKNKLNVKEEIKIVTAKNPNRLYKILLGPFFEDFQLKIIADKLLELGYNFIIINNEENI